MTITFRSLPLSLKILYKLWTKYAPVVFYSGDPQTGKSSTAWYNNNMLYFVRTGKAWDYKKYTARSVKEYEHLHTNFQGIIINVEEGGSQLGPASDYRNLENTVFNQSLQTQGCNKNITNIIQPAGVEIAKSHRRMANMNFEVQKKITCEDIIKKNPKFRLLRYENLEAIKNFLKSGSLEIEYKEYIYEHREFRVDLMDKNFLPTDIREHIKNHYDEAFSEHLKKQGLILKTFTPTKKPKSIVNPVFYEKSFWDLDKVGIHYKFPNQKSHLKIVWSVHSFENCQKYINFLKVYKKSIGKDLRAKIGLRPICEFPGCLIDDPNELIKLDGLIFCYDHAGIEKDRPIEIQTDSKVEKIVPDINQPMI